MNIKFHKSIKGRLFIFVIALFAVGIGAMAVINVTVHNKTLANEISKRSQLIEVSHRQALKISALKLLNQIATSALDFKNLQIEDRHFSYYLVVKNGKTVFHSQRENVSTLPTEDLAWLKSKDLSTPVEDGYYFKNNQEELMAFNMPLHLESKPWGNFLVVFNVDGMKAAQNELVMSLNDQTSQNLLKALSFYGGIFVVALLLILQFSRRLTQSLEQLKQWSQQLANSDFSDLDNIKAQADDEVGQLTTTFGEMAAKLKSSYQSLEFFYRAQEEKVESRTAMLNTKNKELTLALKSLEDSQQQLIQQEKMASLGQLVASIAHEINTPLGAISASATNTRRVIKHGIELFPKIFKVLSDEEVETLLYFLSYKTDRHQLSSREERSYKRKMAKTIEESGIEESGQIAQMLVQFGITEINDEHISRLKSPNTMFILDNASVFHEMNTNSYTILQAIERVSKIVFALKTFSHHDTTGQKNEADINQGIESVLLLYNNLLKQGCELILNLNTLPKIYCYIDELNQVWTNLIHNALQAMDNKGKLTISTSVEGEEVIVQVNDNGPGIPKEIQEKIFDSFFTTKPTGEGTGLGLSICQKILEKHDGTLGVESESGNTTFTARFPIIRAS